MARTQFLAATQVRPRSGERQHHDDGDNQGDDHLNQSIDAEGQAPATHPRQGKFEGNLFRRFNGKLFRRVQR